MCVYSYNKYVYITFFIFVVTNLCLCLSLCNSVYLSHNPENMQSSLLYILPLPNNREVKLSAIYSKLHISFQNIFAEKEKYNEYWICVAITKFFSGIIFEFQKYYICKIKE